MFEQMGDVLVCVLSVVFIVSFVVLLVAFAALACMDVWDEVRERLSRRKRPRGGGGSED